MRDAILIIITLCIFVLLLGVVLNLVAPINEQYVYGHIRIRSRGIYAQVFTREESPTCGCCGALYGGGKVTVKADLSAVQLGDTAEIYTVEGEHLVLECVDIRKGWAWRLKPQGDVIVINGRWMYRLTRL